MSKKIPDFRDWHLGPGLKTLVKMTYVDHLLKETKVILPRTILTNSVPNFLPKIYDLVTHPKIWSLSL